MAGCDVVDGVDGDCVWALRPMALVIRISIAGERVYVVF